MQRLIQILAVLLACAGNSARADSIIIGAEDDAAPWSYSDGSGYVNDLVQEAYRVVGWQVRYEVLPYARCKLRTETGDLLACFSASNTPETAVHLQFSKFPLFTAYNVLFARADSHLQGCSPKDWGRRLTIAFVNEYEYRNTVTDIRNSGSIKAEIVDSEAAALKMLESGRIDAALITVDEVKRIEMVAEVAGVVNRFKTVCNFGGEPAFLAFSRTHPQANTALETFNRGMALLMKNGAVKRLQATWAKKAIAIESAKK